MIWIMQEQDINNIIGKYEQEISVLKHMLAWEKMTINSTYGVKFSDIVEKRFKTKHRLDYCKKTLIRLKKLNNIL